MIRSPVMVMLLGALVAAPLAAQQARQARTGTGQVRGLVFDSLTMRPLAEARVFVRGVARAAVTDGSGRFRLDSVPAGNQSVLFEHDSLDAIGLPAISQPVSVMAGAISDVVLTTPSHFILRRGLCRGQVPAGAADSGVVFGTVRDVDTRQRLAGALVRFRWLRVVRQGTEGPIDLLRPTHDIRTDSIGNYYACGVPADIVLQVQVFAGEVRGGITEASTGSRSIGRHDLTISRLPVPGGDTDTAGNRRGRAVLRGQVLTERGQPRPSAVVTVDDTGEETRTDQEGRFLLRNLPSGSQMVMSRMIGYSAARALVDLSVGDTARIVLRMKELTILDTLQVTAESNWGRAQLDGLEQRLRNRVSGQVLTASEISRLHNPRSALQQFTGLVVQTVGSSQSNYVLLGPLNCRVAVYIDGQIADTQILQSYRPDQFLAIEYFQRGSQAPSFAAGQSCGVVAAWTRHIR